MKKFFLVVLFACSIAVSFAIPAWSTLYFPIQEITLIYNLDKKLLHVQAGHSSNNWSLDYVRMMTVSLNSQPLSTSNYVRQTSAAGFSADVGVNAQVGDVITVELYGTGGTSVSQDLTVTEGVSQTGPPSPDAGSDSSGNSSSNSTAADTGGT